MREARDRWREQAKAVEDRLTAAEAARDEALKLAHMGFHERHAVLVSERDAALARAERLEEAHRTAELLIHSLLGKDDGWETQAAKLLAWSTASAALSPAAE
jgi:hypothetical protein